MPDDETGQSGTVSTPTQGEGESATPEAPETGAEGIDATSAGSEEETGATQEASGQLEEGFKPQSDEYFFDPKQVPPELQSAYKSMERAFHEKTQGIADIKRKADIADQVSSDPHGFLNRLAQHLGVPVPGQNGQQPSEQIDYNTEPSDYKQLYERASQYTQEQLRPILNEVNDLKQQLTQQRKQSFESKLASLDPNWRLYESEMQENLHKYPAMVNDVEALYRASVPQSVLTSRATQEALAKMKRSREGSLASGGTTTTKVVESTPPKGGSFSDTVKWAKEDLARKGVVAPAGLGF